MSPRWEDYGIAYGGETDPPEELWLAAAEASKGRTLYVLGVGFDPRCLVGLQRFLGLALPDSPIVTRLELPPPSAASHPVARALAADNLTAFEELEGTAEIRVIEYPAVQERINAGPNMARALTAPSSLTDVRHIIVDISSLPSTLFFP